jgi:5-methylcytosine-specific restriction endonuclease McrA
MFLASEYTYQKHAVRELLWQAQGGVCACCDRRLVSRYRYPRSGDHDTLEHVQPRAFGGEDKLGNLVLLTRKCNMRKGQRWPTALEVERLQSINDRLGWPTPEIVVQT